MDSCFHLEEKKILMVRKGRKGLEKLALPDIKVYYEANVIGIMWHWKRNRQISEREENIHKQCLVYVSILYIMKLALLINGENLDDSVKNLTAIGLYQQEI